MRRSEACFANVSDNRFQGSWHRRLSISCVTVQAVAIDVRTVASLLPLVPFQPSKSTAGSGEVLDGQDKRGYTAYHHACANGHASVVEALVEQGCNTTIANDFGACIDPTLLCWRRLNALCAGKTSCSCNAAGPNVWGTARGRIDRLSFRVHSVGLTGWAVALSLRKTQVHSTDVSCSLCHLPVTFPSRKLE
eukprot:SAG11_NODE_2017_length_3918_cov_1.984027_2_plen_192_part_00